MIFDIAKKILVYFAQLCWIEPVLCISCVVGQVDVEGVRLNFWDLGGQEELQSLWDKVSF